MTVGPAATAEPGDRIEILGVPGIPEVRAGDDLAEVLGTALEAAGLRLRDDDVVVVSSKIASKALGLVADAGPGTDKDDLVLAASHGVVAERALASGRIVRVVRAAAGPVMAAAGIDASNTGGAGDYLLLPEDPDAVARRLWTGLTERTGVRLGVVLSDTSSRPWRLGVSDFALGVCGLAPLDDLRGRPDADGRTMEVTTRAVADELAAAADLVKGKARGMPVAVIRGATGLVAAPGPVGVHPGRDLVRPAASDWFGYGALEAVRAALGVAPGTALSVQVGIAAAADDESVAERAGRAIRLAEAGEAATPPVPVTCRPGAGIPGVDILVGRAEVSPTDQGYAIGRLVARLEVALGSEGLAYDTVREGHLVRLAVAERAAGGDVRP